MLIFQRSRKARRRLLCCAQQCLHFKSEGETLVKKCWDPQIPQAVGGVAAPRVTLCFVTGKLLWDGAPVALTLCPVVISPSTIFFPQLFLAWPRSDPHTPPAGAPRRAWPRDTRQSRATMRFDASFGRPSPFPSSVPPLPITADTSTRRTDRKPPPGTIYRPRGSAPPRPGSSSCEHFRRRRAAAEPRVRSGAAAPAAGTACAACPPRPHPGPQLRRFPPRAAAPRLGCDRGCVPVLPGEWPASRGLASLGRGRGRAPRRSCRGATQLAPVCWGWDFCIARVVPEVLQLSVHTHCSCVELHRTLP